MEIKYNIDISDNAILKSIKRITNQIYKLLPSREENIDWEKPLETIIEELSGMNRLLLTEQETLFPLLCRLEGLFLLTHEEDFSLFRRTIFECLGLMGVLRRNICKD